MSRARVVSGCEGMRASTPPTDSHTGPPESAEPHPLATDGAPSEQPAHTDDSTPAPHVSISKPEAAERLLERRASWRRELARLHGEATDHARRFGVIPVGLLDQIATLEGRLDVAKWIAFRAGLAGAE